VCCLVHSNHKKPLYNPSHSLLWCSCIYLPAASVYSLISYTQEPLKHWFKDEAMSLLFIFCAHSPSNIVLVLGPLFIWQLSFVTSHWYFALHLGWLAEWAVLVW
jgi:hypothetical protein